MDAGVQTGQLRLRCLLALALGLAALEALANVPIESHAAALCQVALGVRGGLLKPLDAFVVVDFVQGVAAEEAHGSLVASVGV